ncbi:hypothetical protein [Olleya aquimaris]|uniref:Outer membrane protein beta-barrel domain-containing protein n=1 Tax=Olleya aquimaris TaxID=639310 RepID=A0A327RM17_9FLAO|nr:hypothetical protein [Olleya aquimaris]RAJ17949.1 hypothetical protein LY08_00219 [Olleya aquimaris]
MSTKKNIDRLFQEKFKEFEVKPDPKVWQNIQSQLEKDQDKPVVIIPLWLKLSGIAASLALLLFLSKSVLNPTDTSNMPSTVDSKNIDNTQPTDNTTKDVFNTPSKDYNSNSQDNTNQSNTINNSQIVNTLPEESDNSNSNSSDKNTNYNKTNITSSSVANLSNNTNKLSTMQQDGVVSNNTNTNVVGQNTNTANTTNSSNSINNKNSEVVDSNLNTNKKDLDNTKNNNSINDAIAQNKIEEENKEQQKPSIEDAIAQNNTEDLIEKEEVNNRWSVNANISPVYYNTMGQGSHIHEQFNQNKKSGQVNTSYGVQVGYALNDKITVRSGINRLNLSYNTEDVVVYEKFTTSSNNTATLKNVDFASTSDGHELSMISAKNVSVMEVSKSFNAAINQSMSYYEIPLEIEYKILDKRFGINLIGGFSSFVLNDNEVISDLNGVKTKIGEANNINELSFSTNIGVGLNYKFSNTVMFNLEPTFKYQLNAFNETSGNFNPFILGLYTGFSYRF